MGTCQPPLLMPSARPPPVHHMICELLRPRLHTQAPPPGTSAVSCSRAQASSLGSFIEGPSSIMSFLNREAKKVVPRVSLVCNVVHLANRMQMSLISTSLFAMQLDSAFERTHNTAHRSPDNNAALSFRDACPTQHSPFMMILNTPGNSIVVTGYRSFHCYNRL